MESLLFDAFIPAAYRHDPGGRWKAQDAEKWLVFLARHLERTIGSPDLAWWQLRRAAVGVVAGVLAGLAAVAGVVVGAVLVAAAATWTGVVSGVLVGVGLGLVVRITAAGSGWGGGGGGTPAHGMRISVPRAVGWILVGVVVGAGAAAGGAAVVLAGSGAVAGVVVGDAAVVGVVFGAGLGVLAGMEGVPGDPADSTGPRIVLARDRGAALLLMLAGGVVVGVVVGVVSGSCSASGSRPESRPGSRPGSRAAFRSASAKRRGRHTCSLWSG